MKYLFFIIYTLSLGNIFSQVTFFGSIDLYNKMSFNQSYYKNSPIKGTLNFPDFSVYLPPITFDQPKRTAISFGLERKNHRFYIDLLNDAVSSRCIIKVQSYDSINNSFINYSSDAKGQTSQIRLALNYDYQFFGKNEKTNLFLNASFGFCHRSGPKGISPVGSIGTDLNFSPSLNMSYNSSGFTAEAKNAFNFGLGLGSDLFFKKKYLLTLSVFFTHSNQNLYIKENTFTVYKPNSTQEYKINQNFLCSGFYFGFSRKFQLYPWKPIKFDLFKNE